jgi:glycosyltransferase involved in cell wall biosynthesis
MRIGIDARTLRDDFPGIGRYIYNLLWALQPALDAGTLVVLYDPENALSRYNLASLAVRPGVQTVPFAYDLHSPRQRQALRRLLADLSVDVFHQPYYLAACAKLPCPLVLSLFDLIPLTYPPSMPSLWRRLAYRAAVRQALRAAQRIVVPSAASQADLARIFRLPAGQAVVIPGATAPEFSPAPAAAVRAVRERYRLPPTYILHVGTNKRHKNLEALLEAYARYHSQAATGERASLVLVGDHSRRGFDAGAWAAQQGLSHSVLALGSVPDEDLPALYSGAACLAMPSLYEGFGLPVLEAMACGTPVLCSTAASLPEVAGNAALLLDPSDTPAWSEAFARLLGDVALQEALRERSLARAAHFSWPAIARTMLQVYHELLQ